MTREEFEKKLIGENTERDAEGEVEEEV